MEQFTGTREMAASHAFDMAALEAWMRTHVAGFAGPLAVQQFKGGQSNPTYKLSTPQRHYVMRSKPGPVARLLPSAHAIEREYRVMKALAGTGVPVARMEALCEDESVIGRAFFIMEHVDGRVMWEQSLPGMTAAQRGAIYDEMNRVIAALHSVDVAAAGLADYGRPGNYFERQIGRWTKQYLASVTQEITEMDRLIAWLPAHMPAGARDDSQVAVVHGDYRLDNLIFHATEPRIAAVLDWELSTLGHPLADFSYHCMSWHIPPGTFRGIAGLDLEALGIPAERDYVRRYCERVGALSGRQRDVDALMDEWDFYLAYNLFRLASIMQGIVKRAADGIAASAQARATGEATRSLAEMAWHFAKRAGA
ncbi:MAG: phosphotransferase family protein [Rubrivivax sp.]|nr:phosphotransferase family protein [Rubrivivax sp.]